MKNEPTHTSTISEQIRSDIMNGHLAADTKLKTRLLAERFDVGLSPIREALSRLSSEGWVVQSDRRGFSVVPASIDELWNLHRARCMLNEVGLRESIKNGDIAWEENVLLSYIRISRLQRPSELTAVDEIDAWNAQHRTFHTSLIAACGSSRILQYCEQLFDEIERYRRLGLRSGLERGHVSDEHREIAEAAVARDGTLAVRLLNEHFTRTVEQVDQALRSMKT
ncbi:MAG: GntR family transcriptional regulator [Octadecabacter sp.]